MAEDWKTQDPFGPDPFASDAPQPATPQKKKSWLGGKWDEFKGQVKKDVGVLAEPARLAADTATGIVNTGLRSAYGLGGALSGLKEGILTGDVDAGLQRGTEVIKATPQFKSPLQESQLTKGVGAGAGALVKQAAKQTGVSEDVLNQYVQAGMDIATIVGIGGALKAKGISTAADLKRVGGQVASKAGGAALDAASSVKAGVKEIPKSIGRTVDRMADRNIVKMGEMAIPLEVQKVVGGNSPLPKRIANDPIKGPQAVLNREVGAELPHDPTLKQLLPESVDPEVGMNVAEGAEFYGNAKAELAQQATNMLQKASGNGATIPLERVTGLLSKQISKANLGALGDAENAVIKDITTKFAEKAQAQGGHLSLADVQADLTRLNGMMRDKPGYSAVQVQSALAKGLRTILDEEIEKFHGPGFAEIKSKMAGAIQMEEAYLDMLNKSLKQQVGHGGAVDAYAAGQMAYGLIGGNPAAFAKGAYMAGEGLLSKNAKNINNQVMNMNRRIGKVYQPKVAPEMPEITSAPPMVRDQSTGKMIPAENPVAPVNRTVQPDPKPDPYLTKMVNRTVQPDMPRMVDDISTGMKIPAQHNATGLEALRRHNVKPITNYGKFELEMQLKDPQGGVLKTPQGAEAGFKSSFDANTNRFSIDEMELPSNLQGAKVATYMRQQIEAEAKKRGAKGISSGQYNTSKFGRRLWETQDGNLRAGVKKNPKAYEAADGSIETGGNGPVFWKDF